MNLTGDEKHIQQDVDVVLLNKMREMTKKREWTRAQSEVVALAFCNYNLLLRGPANAGKRYIARRASELLMLGRQGPGKEVVEFMTKWFTVSSSGQIIIDEPSLKIGLDQIQRASVLVIENVPRHPPSAAAFFAHLDFICKVERSKVSRTSAQASFGGIQIIATQNDATTDEHEQPTNQILWKPTPPASTTSPSSVVSHPASGAGPTTLEAQMGFLVTTASTPNTNPHHDIFVILFR